MGLGTKGRGRRGGRRGRRGGAVKCYNSRWENEGAGMIPVNHFKVDTEPLRYLCCGGGEIKNFVVRDGEGYGDIENLDPLLDQIDNILAVKPELSIDILNFDINI